MKSSYAMHIGDTYVGPGKKRDFSWQKPWGHFLKTVISRDFFPEHKNREKRGNFTKSVIYCDQKSKKAPSVSIDNDCFTLPLH